MITPEGMNKFSEVLPGYKVGKALLYFGDSGHWKIEKIKPESDDSFYKDYFIEGMGKQVPTHWEELSTNMPSTVKVFDHADYRLVRYLMSYNRAIQKLVDEKKEPTKKPKTGEHIKECEKRK